MKKNKILLLIICTLIVFLTDVSFVCLAQPTTRENSNMQDLKAKVESLTNISMDFRDADLKEVLKILSQQSGVSFIPAQDVKDRKLTLYLEDAPFEIALDAIMSSNNLIFQKVKDSNVFIVKELTASKEEVKLTKIYTLRYIQLKKISSDTTSISTSTTAGTIPSSFVGMSGASTPTGETTSPSSTSTSACIVDVVKNLLSKEGSLVIDTRSNSLIISDFSGRFTVIEEIIKKLDSKLPQVMIEVEIVEVSLGTLNKLGIEFGGATGTIVTYAGPINPTFWPLTKGFPTVPFMKDPLTEKPSIKHDDFIMGSIGSGVGDTASISATLQMLGTRGEVKFLARPRILTLSDEPAQIQISSETAIGLQTTTLTQSAVTQQQAERVTTGTILKVTPKINQEGDIYMLIEPQVTRAVASTQFSQFMDPITRAAKTNVLVKDGQTVVIGGLITSEDRNNLRKVPILGDVPLIGAAFSKINNVKDDMDLVIFITPHLIKDEKEIDRATTLARAFVSEDDTGLMVREQEIPKEILRQFQMEETIKGLNIPTR